MVRARLTVFMSTLAWRSPSFFLLHILILSLLLLWLGSGSFCEVHQGYSGCLGIDSPAGAVPEVSLTCVSHRSLSN